MHPAVSKVATGMHRLVFWKSGRIIMMGSMAASRLRVLGMIVLAVGGAVPQLSLSADNPADGPAASV